MLPLPHLWSQPKSCDKSYFGKGSMKSGKARVSSWVRLYGPIPRERFAIVFDYIALDTSSPTSVSCASSFLCYSASLEVGKHPLFEIFTRPNTSVTILGPNHFFMINATQGNSEHTQRTLTSLVERIHIPRQELFTSPEIILPFAFSLSNSAQLTQV